MARAIETTSVLIVGAGFSGMSAARQLPVGSYILVDSEPEPGGLCRSIHSGGYTFDYTGHLLHLKGEMLREVEELLDGNLETFERRARIRFRDTEIPYPFQVYFSGIPDRDVVQSCMLGLEAAREREPDRTDFESWCRTVFGEGIHRHFMKPYNEKLYRTPLCRISADWIGWIPRPTLEEVRSAASGGPIDRIGYNAVFRYPRRGGIGALAKALSRDIPIRLRTSLIGVNADERQAILRGPEGEFEVRYRTLIMTAPLPAFLAMTDHLPSDLALAARNLESVGVLCLNLGIDGPTNDAHWIYYPEEKYPFFRVGFYHNFSRAAAPEGKSALYVETSFRSGEELGEGYRERIYQGLVEAGIIDRVGRIEHCVELRIGAAYGLHTPERREALGIIVPWLAERGILPIGRYGRWAYTSMGEALSEGRAAGRKAAEAA